MKNKGKDKVNNNNNNNNIKIIIIFSLLLYGPLCIQTLQEEGEGLEGEEFPMGKLTAIVGSQNSHHCHTLIQLALADSAYLVPLPPPAITMEGGKEEVDGVEVEG